MAITINGTTGIAGVDGSASTPALQGSDTNTGIAFPAADTVAFATGGSERMRIDSSGNVGIGTSSPSTYGKFAVSGLAFSSSYYVTSSSGGAAGGARFGAYIGSANVGYVDHAVTNGAGGSETADIRFGTINSGTLAERMRINSNGNVGIGTGSPTRKLQVYGGATGTRTMGTIGNASEALEVGVNASNLATINSVAGSSIIFTQNDTERMRIDSSGRVGIGTTSPSTYGKLAVSVGNGSFMGATTSSGAGGAAGGWQLNSYYGSVKINYIDCELTNGTPAAEASVMRFATIGSGTLAERMRIDSSGAVRIGTTSGNADAKTTIYGGSTNSSPSLEIFKGSTTNTTSQVFMRFEIARDSTPVASGSITANGAASATFTSWSDRNLKENIVDLPSQLANIMALRPVEFDYKGYKNGEGHQIGFIAQEVQQIYPDLVAEGDGGMLMLSDMNKNDARLIKAIQELKADLDATKADLYATKAELAALKGAA